MSQLKIVLLIDEMIDHEFKSYQSLMTLNTNFVDKNKAYLFIRPVDPHSFITKQDLCKIQKWGTEISLNRDDLIEISSSFGVRQPRLKESKLVMPYLLPLDCTLDLIGDKQAINEGFAKIKDSPWGISLSSIDTKTITLEFQFLEMKKDNNFLYPSEDYSFDSKQILTLQESFEREVLKKSPKIYGAWSGIAPFQYHYQKAYDQTGLVNGFSLILLVFVLKFFFGTFRNGLLFIISIVAAILPIFGGMALLNQPVDVLSNALPILILISSLEDFFFVAFYCQKEKKHWRTGFRKFLLPSFFTTLTTVIGFGSLTLANLSIIRRFGAWAALGSLTEYFTVFLLIPALMQTYPKLQKWIQKDFNYWPPLLYFQNWKLPRLIAISSLIILFLGLGQMDRIIISDAPTSVFPDSNATNLVVKETLATKGWQAEASLIFNDSRDRDKNKSILTKIKQHPFVAGIEDPYQAVEFITKNLPQDYWRMVLDQWSESSSYQHLIVKDSPLARSILYLTKQDIVSINSLNKFTSELCGTNCFLAGSLVSYGEFGERVLSTLMESLFVSLFLVGIILIFLSLAQRIDNIKIVLLSALWGPLALIFCFIVFKIPIFYVTSVCASILVGLAGDNSIQFIFGQRNGQTLRGVHNLGGISIYVASAMILTAATMFLSDFAALRKLGLLMIGGILLTVFGDIVILRSLSKNHKS